MTDPFRLTTDQPAHTGPEGMVDHGRTLRASLWVLLVLSVVGNSVTSVVAAGVAVSVALGVVTAACAIALVLVRPGRRR